MGKPLLRVLCVCCQKPGQHNARGLIIGCYRRHHRAKTLHKFPIAAPTSTAWEPTGRIGEATLTKYISLDTRGFSPARIRLELGLSPRQFQRYAKVAKNRSLTSPNERQS